MSAGISATLAGVGPVLAMFLLLRRTEAARLGTTVCVGAAIGLGLGVSSLIWWCLLQVPVRSGSVLLALDAVAWAVIVLGMLAVRRRVIPVAQTHDRSGWRRSPGLVGAVVALLGLAGLAITTFAATSVAAPHGSWDAWAVWNVRARFLFAGLPSAWRDAFVSPAIEVADYPMLVPAAVARLWTFAGADSAVVPVVLAAAFAATVVMVVGASIRRQHTLVSGLLASAMLLASPAFARWAPSQGADVPLSLYMLLTFVMVGGGMAGSGRSCWGLAGLSAGLAAWTKNEGIVFVLVVVVVVAVWTVRRGAGRMSWMPLAALAAGAAPALLILAGFKYGMAPPNLIVDAQSTSYIAQMLTIDRFSRVVSAMGQALWLGGATTLGTLPVLLAYITFAGPTPRPPGAATAALAALALMIAAYGAVYMLTPLNLAWQLSTSLERVLLQLTPSLVWAGMLLTSRPDRLECGGANRAEAALWTSGEGGSVSDRAT